MNLLRSIANVAFWAALCAWIGAIMTVAISATVVFTTLPQMNLSLGEYQAFDQAAHGRLAAGRVMDQVFGVADVVQWIAAPLLVVTMLVHWFVAGFRSRLIANLLLTVCIGAATATLAWQTLSLGPKMDRYLHAYWAAAKSGDSATAREHQAAFEQLHPIASSLYQVRLGVLMVALVLGAATGPSLAPPSRSGGTLQP